MQLKGRAPNTSAIGAQVSLTAGGETQVRDLFPARGYLSSIEPTLTFGLGQRRARRDGLEVRWPDGQRADPSNPRVWTRPWCTSRGQQA